MMKRKLISLMLSLICLMAWVLSAEAKGSFVQDFANIVTGEEESLLTRSCQSVRDSHGVDVVILTTPELYGRPAQDFADDFYDNNGYQADGVLFLVDMGSRQWHISTAGTAIQMLSDRDLEDIEDTVIPYFAEGRYYGGFARFLKILPGYLSNDEGSGINILLSLGAGACIAAVVLLIMGSTMNTKQPQRSAYNYEVEGTYHLRTHQDLFLYSNVSKRAKPKNNDSGSSVHRGSSGRSHGGRGGKF